MTSTEKGQAQIENTEITTSDKLLELKKKVAEDIVNKLQEKDPNLLSFVFKEHIVNYITDDGTLADTIHDELLMWNLWEAVWIINSSLEKYRELFSKANTKAEVEKLKSDILNEIWWSEQAPIISQQSNTTTKGSNEPDWNDKKSEKKDNTWEKEQTAEWIVGKACQTAVDIASDNSYWYERWGTGDNNSKKWFDCQGFVRHCYIQAWINVPPSWWCGTLKNDFEKVWFECITFNRGEKLKPWDILVDPKKHTEICVAEDKIAWAHSNKDKIAWDSGWEEISVRSIKSSLSYRKPQYILRYKWESA